MRLISFFVFSFLIITSALADNKGKSNRGYLERKPYIQYVTPTALSILWETPKSEKCKIELTSTQSNDKWEQISGPTKHHEIRFKGLVPNTKYHYKINTESGLWEGSTTTAPDSDMPFTFLVIGDNRYGHAAHRSVINAMSLESASFYINTGDMVDDGFIRKNWYKFLKIEYPLMKKMALWPVVGNHENAFGKGLMLYHRYFALPENGPQKEKTYYFTWGNSRFITLNTNKPIIGTKQETWFRDLLKTTALDTKIKHIFVIVHQSPYTSGPHGANKELLSSGLVEEMIRFGVDIVFAGHDHIYERGRVKGLNYIISGGGGAPIYYIRTNKPYSIVTEPTYHYCRLFIKGNMLEYSAHRTDGSILDFFTIRKKGASTLKPTFEILKEHKKTLRKKPLLPIKVEEYPENHESESCDKHKSIKNQPKSEQKNQKSSENEKDTSFYYFLFAFLIIGTGIGFLIAKFLFKRN